MFSLLRITTLAAVAAGLAFTGSARADVIYHIEQVTSGTVTFDATLTQPSFIASNVTIPLSDFVVAVNPASLTSVAFSVATTQNENGTCADFGQSSPCDGVVIQNLAVGNGSAFLVPLGALGTSGVYSAHDASIPTFDWTLTVSSSATIPEPTSALLLGTGLLGLGFFGTRRRRFWSHSAITLSSSA